MADDTKSNVLPIDQKGIGSGVVGPTEAPKDPGLVEIGKTEAGFNHTVTVNKVMLSDHMGYVCLTFEKRCDALELTPQEALTMSEAMARQSYRARFGDFPHGGTKQNVEQIRVRLRQTVQLMLKKPCNTEMEQKALAAAIVDECMKKAT